MPYRKRSTQRASVDSDGVTVEYSEPYPQKVTLVSYISNGSVDVQYELDSTVVAGSVLLEPGTTVEEECVVSSIHLKATGAGTATIQIMEYRA